MSTPAPAPRHQVPAPVRRRVLFTLIVLLALLLPQAYAPPPARAASFTVNTQEDTSDATPDGVCDNGAGLCSLREAISEANASPGGDMVNVPAGTYTLTLAPAGEDANVGGHLDILGDLTIIGADRDSTFIDGGGLDRAFDIASGAAVSISGLTVTGGNVSGDGGGIRSQGPLQLVSVALVSNTASGFGGGAYASANLVVEDSLIQSNGAGKGGGIRVTSAHVEVRRSAILDNTSGDDGGGINHESTTYSGKLLVENTTIAGNTANGSPGEGAAIFAWDTASADIRHSTVVYNVGLSTNGIDGNSHLYLGALTAGASHLIVAYNTAVGDDTTTNCAWPSTPEYTLVWPNEVCNGAIVADPLLGTRGTYGGTTPLYPLPPGSPAIDAGGPEYSGLPATDQRGTNSPRKIGSAVDIGAFEFRPAIAVNTTEDTLDTNPGDGVCADGGGLCSLRAAISEANSLLGPDEIRLNAATYTLTIDGIHDMLDYNAWGDLDVTDDLTITGSGRLATFIQWAADDTTRERILDLQPPAGSVHLAGITIRNGGESFPGGGILFNRVDLTLTDVGVSDNRTWEEGGGLYGICGNLTVTDSVIENSSSLLGTGGGALLEGAGCTDLAASISNTRVASNGASNSCGGMWIGGISLTVTRSTIQGNSAGRGAGGGLCVSGQPVQISTSAILDNSSGGEGGAYTSRA